MSWVLDYPLLVFAACLVAFRLSVSIGTQWARRFPSPEEGWREDFSTVLGASLTLLGLIIGFTFAMAVSRYDQRKNLEEEEANAIGTEFARADLLPAADAAKVRDLMRGYYEQRVLFYTTRDAEQLKRVDARTAQLQGEMWSAVVASAGTSLLPAHALVISGMNDVLNAQGYAQAAWWNRIPTAAWVLMAAIAVCCHVLIGFGARNPKLERVLLFVLPLVVSIAFFLVADIDSPRGGVIRVQPINLTSIAASLRER